MSSYYNGGFEEWLEDSVFRDRITDAQWAALVETLEPWRHNIDVLCDAYEEETQSWRDYRNSLWDLLPKEINDRVRTILQQSK